MTLTADCIRNSWRDSSFCCNKVSSANCCHPLFTLCFLTLIFAGIGCGGSKVPPGTPENLKADYDRAIQQQKDQEKVHAALTTERENVWRQRMVDKESKIAELTADNATLRQRALATEAALNDIPLVDNHRDRSVMWLHITYSLIVAAMTGLFGTVLWLHYSLRERVRYYVLQHARLVPSKGVVDVQAVSYSKQ